MIPKINVKNILYATDLSENALYAFGYAVSLADAYGAKLTLLHVLSERPNLDARVIGYVTQSQWDAIKETHVDEARQALIGKQKGHGAVREVLDRFSKNAKTENGVEPDEIIVRRGNPVEEILAQAEENGSDLIVLGAHGNGTLADTMMGSTVRRVLRRSNVPVVTVRLPE
jgi:nucleotide-binding universal stress UspA family protein